MLIHIVLLLHLAQDLHHQRLLLQRTAQLMGKFAAINYSVALLLQLTQPSLPLKVVDMPYSVLSVRIHNKILVVTAAAVTAVVGHKRDRASMGAS